MADAIVISGWGAMTPIGRSPADIVTALRRGTSSVKLQSVGDPPIQCWFGSVENNLLPREHGDSSDRATAFALTAAQDALTSAQFDYASISPERGAVIVSSSKGLMTNLTARPHTVETAKTGATNSHDLRNFHRFSSDTPSLEISRMLGWVGPSLSYPAACATGLASIIAACRLLQDHNADVVLAGSTEAAGHALVLAGFQQLGSLSPKLSVPYTAERHGFNPGEGAAVFTMERESNVLARGGKILACLAGWDLRSDAYSSTGIDPTGSALAYSIRRSMDRAGWKPGEVEFVNTHGTGTVINDAVECAVIQRIWGTADLPSSPCVSALKPVIGHLLGASASAELALCLAGLRSGFISPTLGLTTPASDCLINHVPPGGVNRPISRFMKLSLGFGGHVGSLALELPPEA